MSSTTLLQTAARILEPRSDQRDILRQQCIIKIVFERKPGQVILDFDEEGHLLRIEVVGSNALPARATSKVDRD